MNKLKCIFFMFMVLNPAEHNIPAPKPVHHITIDVDIPDDRPERPDIEHNSPNTTKIKTAKIAAVTAIITALISAGVALAVHFSTNNCS